MTDDIIILCHDNPEFPDRNFIYGKDIGENIIYCSEENCKKMSKCIFKNSIKNWR